jgi:hypothetical protein
VLRNSRRILEQRLGPNREKQVHQPYHSDSLDESGRLAEEFVVTSLPLLGRLQPCRVA